MYSLSMTDINKCSTNPCVNGQCKEWPAHVHGYMCVCDEGWYGNNCDVSASPGIVVQPTPIRKLSTNGIGVHIIDRNY